MASPSGISAQFGLVKEATYGVPLTPTVFGEITGEKLKYERERIESDGLRPRRIQNFWAQSVQRVQGDLEFELPNVGIIGPLLRNAFGGYAFAQDTPVVGANTHTFTPGDIKGKGLTCQIGRPQLNASVQAATLNGTKVTDWEVSTKAGEYAKAKLGLYALRENTFRTVADGVTTNLQPTITSATASFTTNDVGFKITGTGIPASTTILSVQSPTAATLSANATATGASITFSIGEPLATATYPAALNPFTFVKGDLKVAGTSVDVMEASVKCDNNLAVDRHFVRATDSEISKEPEESGRRVITGKLKADFTDLSLYNRYVQGIESTLTLTHTSSNFITGTTPFSLAIALNMRFDGTTPEVKGPELLQLEMAFKAIGGASDAAACTITLVNNDTTYA